MAGEKSPVTFDINHDAHDMLKRITQKYKLADKSKALRCLLDYAATDGDWDEIFAKVRCRRCG